MYQDDAYCLQEKIDKIEYPVQKNLLNKRSELANKCIHANKFQLKNYKNKKKTIKKRHTSYEVTPLKKETRQIYNRIYNQFFIARRSRKA